MLVFINLHFPLQKNEGLKLLFLIATFNQAGGIRSNSDSTISPELARAQPDPLSALMAKFIL